MTVEWRLMALASVIVWLGCSTGAVVSLSMNEFQRGLSLDSVYQYHHGSEAQLDKASVRVVDWNLAQCRSLEDQLAVLERLAPDILVLQEVDWNNARSGNRNCTEEIARRLGMNGCFAIEFFELQSEARSEAIGPGGGVTGNAVLSTAAVRECARTPLTTEYFDWEAPATNYEREVAAREPRLGGRIALTAVLAFRDTSIVVSSVHLEDKAGGMTGRIAQMDEVMAVQESLDPEHGIVAGDLNTYAHRLALWWHPEANHDSVTREKGFWTPEAAWWAGHYFPDTEYADPFDKRKDWTLRRTPLYRGKLDWLLVKGLSVTDQGMGDLRDSDHRLLWVDLAAGKSLRQVGRE